MKDNSCEVIWSDRSVATRAETDRLLTTLLYAVHYHFTYSNFSGTKIGEAQSPLFCFSTLFVTLTGFSRWGYAFLTSATTSVVQQPVEKQDISLSCAPFSVTLISVI